MSGRTPRSTGTSRSREVEPLAKGRVIAEKTQFSRKQASSVLEAISGQIERAPGKRGSGVFALPGLLMIVVIRKPATPVRQGIDRFTKLERIFKAKPARRVVKAQPLRALEDLAK